MRNKLLVSLITIAIVLTACGNTDKVSKRKKTDTKKTVTETVKDDEEETTEEITEKQDVSVSEIRGEVKDNTYTNEFFGFKFDIDSSWTVFDENQLLQLAGLVADSADDEALSKVIENSGVIYDFYATEGLKSANIVMQSRGLLSSLDMKEYVELSVKQAESNMPSMGIDNVTTSVSTVNISGKDYYCATITGVSQGMDIYEKMVFFDAGEYIASLTVGTFVEDNTDELIAKISGI